MTAPNHSACDEPTTELAAPLTARTTLTLSSSSASRDTDDDDDDDHDILYDPPDDLLPPPKPVGDEPEDPTTIPDLAATG